MAIGEVANLCDEATWGKMIMIDGSLKATSVTTATIEGNPLSIAVVNVEEFGAR